jgi:hypothetical protein
VPARYRRRIGRSKVSGTISGSVKAGVKILHIIARQAIRRRLAGRVRPGTAARDIKAQP